jgi:hypothetical protein
MNLSIQQKEAPFPAQRRERRFLFSLSKNNAGGLVIPPVVTGSIDYNTL